MKVIRPTTITDAMLISSTVAEPSGTDPAVWNAATAYVVGDEVYRAGTHSVYTRLVNGTTATAPELDTTNWVYARPTNRWAMFDQEVGTQSSGASPMTVVMDPGTCGALALLEIDADEVTVTMTDGAGGPTVYSRTTDLDASYVTDWFEYFFGAFSKLTSLVLTDLPPYSAGRITVTLTGESTVLCGGLVAGTAHYLGGLQYGARAGIRDYSVKSTDDDTGIVTLTPGRYRKTVRGLLQLPTGAVNSVHKLLTELRATNVVWIGDDQAEYEPLVVFGFARSFELTVTYPGARYYALEIEGMQ